MNSRMEPLKLMWKRGRSRAWAPAEKKKCDRAERE